VVSPRLVVATFAFGATGVEGGAPVDARVVFADLRAVDRLQRALKDSVAKDMTFYMYDCLYLIFLNDAAEVTDAYVYYPVTKPHGGFLKAEARRLSATRFEVKQEGFDRGRYSAEALELINRLVPEELIWSLAH
jgi:hypothetical protein